MLIAYGPVGGGKRIGVGAQVGGASLGVGAFAEEPFTFLPDRGEVGGRRPNGGQHKAEEQEEAVRSHGKPEIRRTE